MGIEEGTEEGTEGEIGGTSGRVGGTIEEEGVVIGTGGEVVTEVVTEGVIEGAETGRGKEREAGLGLGVEAGGGVPRTGACREEGTGPGLARGLSWCLGWDKLVIWCNDGIITVLMCTMGSLVIL